MSTPTPAKSPAFTLTRDALGRWICRLAGDDGATVEHPGVMAVRVFPLTAPDEAVSIVDAQGRECLHLPDLAALPPGSLAAVREALAEREFVPVIERLRAVSTFATPSTWTVDTDRGPTSFVLKGEEDIRRLPRGRLLVTSAHGVVFDIRDLHRLDRPSRRLLERFL